MFKEEIIKYWIQKGCKSGKAIRNIHYDDSRDDINENNPYFCTVFTGHSLNKAEEYTLNNKMIAKVAYTLNLKNGKLTETNDTKKFPFFFNKSTKPFMVKLQNILFNSPIDNFKQHKKSVWDFASSSSIKKAVIIRDSGNYDDSACRYYTDVLVVKLQTPMKDDDYYDLSPFENSRITFSLYRIGSSMYDIIEDPVNNTCLEAYDSLMKVKEELKKEFEEIIKFKIEEEENTSKVKFDDDCIVSVYELYDMMKDILSC